MLNGQLVAHSQLNLIVAREGGWQDDIGLSREYHCGIDNSAVLVLNSKSVVRMIDGKGQSVVFNAHLGY